MPRRSRPRTGAAGPGGSADPRPAGSGGPVAIPSEKVPMEPSSKGSGSTGEMLPPTQKGSAWIHGNPNKKGAATATASSRGVHPGKGSVSSRDKKAATVGGAPMVHPGKLAAGAGSASTGDMLQKKADAGSSGGKGATRSGTLGAMIPRIPAINRVPGMSYAAVVASSGPNADMLQKRAVDTGLNEEIPKKKATALSGDSPALGSLEGNTTAQDCEESAAKNSTKKGNTLTSANIAQKKCTEGKAPDMNRVPGMSYAAVVASSGSTVDMLQNKAALGSSQGAPMTCPGKGATGSGSSGTMLQKKVAVAPSGGRPTTLPGKRVVDTGLNEEIPKKKATALSGDSPALVALDRKTTAPDCEESAAKLSTSAKIGQKNCTEDKAADMGLSRGMLQKQSSKMEVDTSLSREMLQDYPAEEANTAKDIQGSDSNEIVHIKDELTQELESFLQELNDLGKGEDISNEEFLDYLKGMPSGPRLIHLEVSLEDEEFDMQENRHALYRLRYYKYKFEQQASKEELHGDKLKEDNHISLLHKSDEFLEDDLHYDKLKEDRHLSLLHKSEKDCDDDFLEEEGFFRRFEEDETFDWFFHPDYLGCSSLNDYQCLVLKNYAGTEYSRWSKYHKYLNSYEIELEYVKYCEELTKQLKWMEDYVDTNWPCYKWNEISSRGVYQAVKIAASSFHKITPALAYTGFFECTGSMVYDYTFFKELDCLYFEIWRRITYETKSFKEAVEEVYKLNRFLSRQHYLKAALEFDDAMKMLEKEFHTCMGTAAITPEVQDRAQELILEAVKKQVNKPKYYEQYIRKKMDIARIIGILDSEESR